MEDRSRGADAFTTALSQMKRRGASLLIVGAVGESVHADACRMTLGDPDPDTAVRRRVLGVTGGVTTAVDERLPVGATRDDAHLRVVDRETGPDDAGVGAFGARVVNALADLSQATHGGPDPGELRVCVDALTDLVGDADRTAAATFCHLFDGAVADTAGIGHVHLERPFDDDLVTALSPLFDAVVELGDLGGRPAHRWRVRDGPMTEWLSVASVAPGRPTSDAAAPCGSEAFVRRGPDRSSDPTDEEDRA
jgi:hypothetical protein